MQQGDGHERPPIGRIGLETNSPQFPYNSFPSGNAGFRVVPNRSETFNATSSMLGGMSATTPTRYPGLEKRLRNRRLLLGMTFEGLARESRLSSRTLRNWENAEATPNLAFLSRVCAPLACSLDWLLYGDDKEPEHGNDRSTNHEG